MLFLTRFFFKPGIKSKVRILCKLCLHFYVFFYPIQSIQSQSPGFQQKKTWDSDWSDLRRDPGALYGSEKDEKYTVNALILEIEDWDNHYSLGALFLYRYTNYPKFTSHSFFPFYGNMQAKHDPRFRNFIFPLYYYKTDGFESDFLTPISWSYRNPGENEVLDLFALFYRHHEADEKFYSLFPLLFFGNNTKGGTGFFTLFPLLNYDYISCTDQPRCNNETSILNPLFYYENIENRSSTFLSWLGYYDYSLKRDEMTLFFPILPIFYRYTHSDKQTQQLIGNIYYSSNAKDSSGTFQIWPLFFSNWADDSGGSLFFPLYSYQSAKNSDYFYSILFGWDSTNQESDIKDSMNYSLLHYNKKSPDKSAFHLFPLYYSFEYKHVTDTFLLPIFYSTAFQDENKKDSSVYHLLGYTRFYNDDVHKQSGFEWLLFPIWYSATDDSSKSSISSMYNLLFGRKKNVQSIDGELFHDSSFWFPIVPILYSSTSNEKSTTVIVPAWWQVDHKKDELVKLGIFPLYMADYYPDGYQHILPLLYFSFSDSTKSENEYYRAFAPLHYHHRRGDRLTFWLGPYYSYSDESDQDYTDHILPLYYSWWDKKSKGNILLPLYVSYEDKNKYFHLNLGGLSFGQEKTLTTNVIKDGGAYHIDSEFGFLYNLLRIETRVTLFANEVERIEKKEEPVFPEPEFNRVDDVNLPSFRKKNKGVVDGPKITRDLVKNRENSNTFWGITTFFGIASYEKADTHRHFRILPLSWLSWNESDNDQVSFVFAAYASYSGEDSRYFALFPAFVPIYGFQEDNNSRMDVFALIVYIKESEKSNDYNEHSILWPLLNFYSSPAKSGFRLFPIVWHKEEYKTKTDKDNKPIRDEFNESSTWALLFYDSQDHQGGWQTFFPLYYASSNIQNISENQRKVETILLGLPLLYYNNTIHLNNDGDEVVNENNESSLFIPGYYRKRSSSKKVDSYLFGILSFKSEYKKDATELNDKTPISKETNFLFGLASFSSNQKGESDSWFFPLYYYDNDSSGVSLGFPILPVLFYHESDKTFSTTWVPPVYWNNEKGYKSRLIANFWYSHEEKNDKTAFHILPIYLSWIRDNEKSFFVSGFYFNYNDYGNHQNLFGILYDRQRTYSIDRTEHCLALCIISMDSRKNSWEFEMLWGGLMGIESKEKSSEFGILWGGLLGVKTYGGSGYDFNLLWIGVDHNYNRRFEHNFLPLWYIDRNIANKNYEYYVPALLSWGDSAQNHGSHYWALGLLYYDDYNISARQSSEHWLLGTLWQDIRKPERGYRTRGMLWRLLWEYQIEEDTDYSKFSILKFLFSRTHKNGDTSYRVLGIKLN